MSKRKNGNKLGYDENALKLGEKFFNKCTTPMEMFFYLMKHKRVHTLTVLMVHSSMHGLEDFLKSSKRVTDLLIPIDKNCGLYTLMCQETRISGGCDFAKRLIYLLKKEGEEDESVVSVVTVENYKYPIEDVLFTIYDNYIKTTKGLEPNQKICFHSIR